MNLPLRGIIPPIVTPLLSDNEIDIQGLEKLIEHVISGGVHGIFLLGTTGEAPNLSYELRKEFIKKLDLHSDGKDIHLEILYKAKILGAKIHEIPADLAWKESKLKSKGKVKKRRSTLKIRKTSGSHLFFAMLNKPGFIYTVPACLLLAVSFIIFAISLVSIGGDMTQNGVDLYSATRNSMINATPSWLTLAVSFVLAIQFFSLGFLTNQHKKNYEETYKTLHSILKEIRNNN